MLKSDSPKKCLQFETAILLSPKSAVFGYVAPDDGRTDVFEFLGVKMSVNWDVQSSA